MPIREVNSSEPKPNTPQRDIKQIVFKWGPRAVVALFFGYYALGVAYEFEIMAKLDKVAIPVIKYFGGRAGIGAAMPYFQQYSALGIRFAAAAFGGLLYDRGEKIVRYFIAKFSKPQEKPKPLSILNFA
jgi:hypothetical protein